MKNLQKSSLYFLVSALSLVVALFAFYTGASTAAATIFLGIGLVHYVLGRIEEKSEVASMVASVQ